MERRRRYTVDQCDPPGCPARRLLPENQSLRFLFIMKSQSRLSGAGLLVRRVRSRLALRKCFVLEATRSLTSALLSQFRRNHWRSRLGIHCHQIGPYRRGTSVPSLEVPGLGVAGGGGYTLCESLPNLKACVWRIFHALYTRVPPICHIACPGPVVSLGPHTWIPRSKSFTVSRRTAVS